MRKSQYGKELLLLWEGWRDVEEVQLVPTPSTLLIEDELQEKIDAEWAKVLETDPDKYDGLKWRYEHVHPDDSGKLLVYVSESRYSQHSVVRHVQNQPIGFYPNPISANTIQETSDGYILLGVRGRGSDQKGLCLMGSGFVERREENDTSKKPGRLGYVVQDECLRETIYVNKESFDMNDARVMNLMFGSNHDTSIGVYLPIFATHNQVSVASDEHSDLLFLPNNPASIQSVLNKESYKGIPAPDHLLGSLESYLINLEKGNITPKYQHK